MEDRNLRWAFTFVLLFLTVGWAGFVMWMVWFTANKPSPVNVMELSGVSVLLGALIVWNGNVNQFWFRKKPSSEVKT